jgi:hypothetical protein
MLASQLLIQAKDRIKDPENWTKYAYQRTIQKGIFFKKEIVSYCAYGAVPLHCNVEQRARALNILDQAAQEFGFSSALTLNDDAATKHALVLMMFDRAIEIAQEKELIQFNIQTMKEKKELVSV